jgi:hypothetical protein
VVRKLLQVGLLLLELLLERQELLPLALADGELLLSTLTALEGIAVGWKACQHSIASAITPLGRPEDELRGVRYAMLVELSVAKRDLGA